jgi:hypothetical protein
VAVSVWIAASAACRLWPRNAGKPCAVGSRCAKSFRIGCTVLLSQEPGQRQMAPGREPFTRERDSCPFLIPDGLLSEKIKNS